MISGMSLRSKARVVLLVLLGSTLAGVYFATQVHFAYPPSVRSPWGEALAINLVYYVLWGAAVPLVVAIARRFRFESRWWLALAAHALGSVLLTVSLIVTAETILAPFRSRPITRERLLKMIQINFHSSLPTYWLILFAYYALDYSSRAARLKASLTEARLEALKTQLNPHFLFNTLNSISSLMYSDVEAADRMMTRLSELLRSTIHNDAAQEVTLREELGYLDRYLEIERIRFEERLRVSIEIDPDASEGLVPAFSLQPLVENALRHGIGPRESGGSVRIEARHANGQMRLCVSDDGAGSRTVPIREGVGMKNTRLRLEQLYGDAASLRSGDARGGGFLVEVIIPFRTADRGQR
jgi:two-component sensor histidine kinase